jgi:hypothetical protein
MGTLIPGDSVFGDFYISSPETGSAINADAAPSGVLVRGGSDTGESVSVQNKDLGLYRFGVTIPSTYDEGDYISVRVSASVGGSLGRNTVFSTVLDASRITDLNNISLGGVRTQVGDGLSGIGLDHLLSLSATDSDIVDGTFISQLAASSGDWSQFNKNTDSLEAIRDRGDDSWTTGAAQQGAGASAFPIVVNDEDGNPIDGVECWVSTDSSGGNVIAGTLNTDANGGASFMLDAGDYYLFRQKGGYNFNNPLSFTVG